MEIKHFAIEEVKTDDDSRTIEGWASVYDFTDSYKDIVVKGAFAKSLKKGLPAMLWQHDSADVIGVWDEAEEQDRGLWVKGRLADTQEGIKAYKLLKMGALKGLSIGYTPKKHEFDRDKEIRKLLEVELHEVSLVTFPANERAKVVRVKAVEMTEREFEEHLRDAGFSDGAAKTIIAKGFKALGGNQRDAEVAALGLACY